MYDNSIMSSIDSYKIVGNQILESQDGKKRLYITDQYVLAEVGRPSNIRTLKIDPSGFVFTDNLNNKSTR